MRILEVSAPEKGRNQEFREVVGQLHEIASAEHIPKHLEHLLREPRDVAADATRHIHGAEIARFGYDHHTCAIWFSNGQALRVEAIGASVRWILAPGVEISAPQDDLDDSLVLRWPDSREVMWPRRLLLQQRLGERDCTLTTTSAKLTLSTPGRPPLEFSVLGSSEVEGALLFWTEVR